MNELINSIMANLAGARGATEVTPLFRPLFGPFLTPLLFAAIVFSAVWLYRTRGIEVPRGKRYFLLGLRIIAILCLLPILWEVGLRVTTSDPVRPVLAVAVDTSGSMTIQDRYITPESQAAVARAIGEATGRSAVDRLSRFDLAKQMLASPGISFVSKVVENANLEMFGFDSTARSMGGNRANAILSASAAGEQTSISSSIGAILSSLRGQPLSAIVLMTDGQHNSGESPGSAAERWTSQNVRIVPVVLGDPEPRDLEIRQVIADSLMFRGDPVNIYARIRQRGYGGRKIPVILRDAERELARVDVDLASDRAEQTVAIKFTPETAGEIAFKVVCPVLPDEIVEDNNERAFTSRVTDEKIKVLYVEYDPRWQYRFLKEAMLRDHRVNLEVLLLHSERRTQPELPYLGMIPQDRESLTKYDLYMFGDISSSVFSEEQMQWIRDHVADEGAGILFMSGPRSMPWSFDGTPLAPLVPVEFNPQPDDPGLRPARKEEERFRLQVTPEGLSHPIMALASGYSENSRLWEMTPETFWFAEVRRARPGAVVLAAHPSEKAEDRPLPLIADQPYGRGRAVFVGLDETWRWRFKQGDRLFYNWWGQIIQYLGAPHLTGASRRLEVKTDRARYARGETALVTVRMADVQDFQDRAWFAVAEDSAGNRQRVSLKRSEASERLLEGRIPLMHSGIQRIALEGSEAEASALVEVEAPRAEFMEPAANLQLMQEVANQTGGFVVLPQDFPDLANRLDLKPMSVETQKESLLWDRNWLIIVFTLALALEWIFRRLGQLP